LLQEAQRRGIYSPPQSKPEPEPEQEPELSPEEWVKKHFPGVVSAPFGDRHHRFWRWVGLIVLGRYQEGFASIWPRGSGKSTNAEFACVYAGMKGTRRFALYVCATQEQANAHVDAIRTWFEQLGVGMLLSAHGQSKGWKANKLRTENGFNVMAVGLDVGTRGLKLDQFRPDLIILDDIDSEDDSKLTVAKKIRKLTSAILPAGSTDCCVLFVQNLIHENGLMAMVADKRADFLHDIEADGPHVAVEGLQVERQSDATGKRVYRIVSGSATWEGQSLKVCEEQINKWGYQAFLREAQHEVKGVGGVFFKTDCLQIIDDIAETRASDDAPMPKITKIVVPCDFAATEGAGDYTAFGPIGKTDTGAIVVFDLFHEQRSSERVRESLFSLLRTWRERLGTFTVLIPRDPGQAGVDQAEQLASRMRTDGFDVKIIPISGKKATRARTSQEKINGGDVYLMRGSWNAEFIDEHRLFREDESHDHDDIADMMADGVNELELSGWTSTAAGMEELAKILASM
jgi:predicted phage terminase large subunit-like protein